MVNRPANKSPIDSVRTAYTIKPQVFTPGENGISLPKVVPAKGIPITAGLPKVVAAQEVMAADPNPNNFSSFNRIEGLGSSVIQFCYEDKNGNLWIATGGDGVTKYDGHNFTTYTQTQGLCNDGIEEILEDHDGNLWFASWGGGLSKFDGESFTNFTFNEGLGSNYIGGIILDKNNHLWATTLYSGIVKYDGKTFTHYDENSGMEAGYVDCVLEDRRGNLWFGTNQAGLIKFDGKSFHHFDLREVFPFNWVADLLEAIGCEVHREYYVNDAGRQMDILATSVWLRYLELAGEELVFPSNGYKGDYVWDIGATLHREHGDDYRHSIVEVYENVPADEPEGGDKEEHIDALIAKAKQLLGDNRYRYVFELGLNTILDNIRADLEAFGVTYEEWYSERGLTESGAVNKMLERLRDSGYVYEKDGALWFKSSDFGDEKDRVVQRDNGQTTYFASDIAYHMEKLERGFDHVIDVWGADHHGYVPRVRAALRALGDDDSKLEVLLVQFANLYSQGEKMQMSTRSGEFVTLRELRQEVGADAARFFYVMRKCEQHLDFDLDLAKSQSSDNPVYYIQYAHARIHSVLRQMEEKGMSHDMAVGAQHLDLLTESHEEDLINRLGRFPEVVESAALNREPHQLVHFLRDLANAFHTYYNAHQFLVDAEELRSARLNLCLAARQVLSNGLRLLGVSAPEEM